MPKFYELYGASVGDKTANAVKEQRAAYCPFTDAQCDGGGNRHQTKIKLRDSILRNHFAPELEAVVPGVCSIDYGNEAWIVCPRRLLGFRADGGPRLAVNHALQQHERDALISAKLPRAVNLGVWSEVYLRYGDDESSINYHFDFVIAPVLRGCSFQDLMTAYGVTDEAEVETFKKAAKVGKHVSGRFDTRYPLDSFPDLGSPYIVEVMTASTSGSDKEVGTDIASAFSDALLGKEYNCPGINKRQVWGRMATQLFAKSALAESWGGKTIWLVQDQLLSNIQETTKLRIDVASGKSSGTVNFLSMAYERSVRGGRSLKFDRYVEVDAGLEFSGNGKCTDILLPKVYPEKKHLLMAVLRQEISGIIRL